MKKVVVIGGGFAGAYCAKTLEKDFDVTLVDTKDYFEFTPSILRTIVEPEHIKKIQVLHTHYLHKAKVIRGDVLVINETKVVCNNVVLDFDYLVITSGSKYNTPFKHDDIIVSARAHELRECYDRLCGAKDILIVGGGLVGVEIAAEIVTHYSSKNVTIVHSHDRLMERQPLKASKYVEKYLKKKGVTVLLNERVDKHEGNVFFTNKGNKIKTEMPFLCVGIKANAEFMDKSFPDKLDKRHCIKVNKYLQLTSNIFVAGDVTAINEEKTAQNAEKQAAIVVHNIMALENGKELREYVSKSRVMVMSLGKCRGVLSYKNFALTGILPGFLKSIIEWKTMRNYR
jgi:apoptosis-inducing factor 2